MKVSGLNPLELARLACRWLALLGMSFWLGGFTFYGAVVIPILHDEMGGLDSGLVTGRVSNYLNAFGVAALVVWWVLQGLERDFSSRWPQRIRAGLLGLTTSILILLIALHPVMDRELESGTTRYFRRLHLVYLNASTVQWGVNLALLAISVWIWQGVRARRNDVPHEAPGFQG